MLTPLALTAIAAWLYLLLARGAFWRMRQPSPPPEPAPRATIAVIVPARNETAVVARSLASLASQVTPGAFHIILVDDASTDGTAATARAAVPSERLTVLESSPLPPGWTGKLWALHQGIQYAARYQPDYLLLTDADIEHPAGNLAALLARAAAERCHLVSQMATLHCESLAERFLIPPFVFFFFMLYPPAWILDPHCATAGAAGGCMLVRREALEWIGGIAAIRGQLIDDCALARVIKHSGGRICLDLNCGTRSIRPYRGFAEIEGMIARTAFTQLNHSAFLLAITVVGLALVYLAPLVMTIAAQPPASLLGAAAWVLMSLAYYPTLRFYRLSWLWAPTLPLAAAFYLAATCHSAVAHWRGRGGWWKGRPQGR